MFTILCEDVRVLIASHLEHDDLLKIRTVSFAMRNIGNDVLKRNPIKINLKGFKKLKLDRTPTETSSILQSIDHLCDLREIMSHAFHWACKFDQVEFVDWLYTTYSLTEDIVTENECNSFRWACRNGNINILKWMSQHGCNKDNILTRNIESFRWACTGGKLGIVEWLISEYKFSEEEILDNNIPFIGACCSGEMQMAKWFFSKMEVYFTPVQLTERILTALQWACCCEDIDIIKWLIHRNGANPRLTARDLFARDNKSLEWACEKGNLEIVQYLIDGPIKFPFSEGREKYVEAILSAEGTLQYHVSNWLSLRHTGV